MPPPPPLSPLPLPLSPAFFLNLANNPPPFLPNLDNHGNNDPPFPTSKCWSNFNKGIALAEAEPIALTTTDTQKSMPKINLLPKVEEISEVEEIIPKNEEKITFSDQLNRLFPAAEELIRQDHEIEEVPLPNHEEIMEGLKNPASTTIF